MFTGTLCALLYRSNTCTINYQVSYTYTFMTNVSTVCILEQAWATSLTYRGDIDEADNETETGDAEQQYPVSHIRQMITEDAKCRAEQRNGTSNAKNKQHDEE